MFHLAYYFHSLLYPVSFLEVPTATDIQITNRELLRKLTISVCKNKNSYKTESGSVDSFLGNTSSFWEETFDIEDMISDVSFVQN